MGFTPDTINAFGSGLMRRMTEEAMGVALSVIPSEQLREKLTPRIHSATEADLFLSPYWALFVHDGHRTIAPVRARFLVYYKDRSNDPRRPGGKTPDRLADERRLTPGEFQSGLAENRRMQQLNPGGGPNQFMIVVQDSRGAPGKSGPAQGTPFFETLMLPFEDAIEDVIYDEFERFVLRELADEAPDGDQRPIRFDI